MAKNFCSNCGERLSSEDQFCGSCGERIKQHTHSDTEYERSIPDNVNKEKIKSSKRPIIVAIIFLLFLTIGGITLFLNKDSAIQDNISDNVDTNAKVSEDNVDINISDLTVDDLLNNYDFYFVSEGYEAEEIDNALNGKMRITSDDGLYYMDFFEFTDHISTQIDYKKGSISGSLHTENVDMDLVGLVEIIDNHIVLSGTMVYENYEMQDTFAGSWSTSESKLKDMIGNIENNDIEKIVDQQITDDILGSYTGALTVRQRTKELVSSLEEKIGHRMEISFDLLVDQDGVLYAQSKSTTYDVEIQGNSIIFEMNDGYMGIYMKGELETLSQPHIMSGEFDIWLSSGNNEDNIYIGDWHISQTEVIDKSTSMENESVMTTNYIYQPGYRYEFETYKDDNVRSYQLLTFRVPGKTYSSFILIEDDEYKQMRHYYIEEGIAYTYLEGNENNPTVYMPLELSIGTRWEGLYDFKEVHSIGGDINSNYSSYSPILSVKKESKDSDDVSMSYYAPNVGFIEGEKIVGESQTTKLMNRAELSESEKQMIQGYYKNATY